MLTSLEFGKQYSESEVLYETEIAPIMILFKTIIRNTKNKIIKVIKFLLNEYETSKSTLE